MEEYEGVKFKSIEIYGEVLEKGRLLEVDKLLSKFLKTKGNEGNLSVRFEKGFLIKRAGSQMTKLKEEDVIFVKEIKEGKVYASGGVPSSEAGMHYEIYKNRKDVKIILHFHDDRLLERKNKGYIEIEPCPYGTEELANAVAEAAKKSEVIKIKKHGFVIVARSKVDLIKKIKEVYL